MYVYLSTSEEAVSAVLVRAEGKEHKPIYYVSKTLQGTESRYIPLEKLALTLITASRKLRTYFQSHLVTVLTNHPLKHVMASPSASGRMVKWALELSEHGIEFQPRPAIKAQVLTDFLLEMTTAAENPTYPEWKVYVDGSSASAGSGVRIVIQNPKGDKLDYAIKLEFPASNNEAEYKAVLAGCRLALVVGAR